MAHRRSRSGESDLFDHPNSAKARALIHGDPEIIRFGFSELSRCDHCDRLDARTLRFEVKGPISHVTEKRWLHPECAANFDPEWRRCACYNDGLADSHYFRWEGERGRRFIIRGRR